MSEHTEERWLPIPGWDGLYEVSDLGRVRSLDRQIVRSDGVLTHRRGQILDGAGRGQYPRVTLYDPRGGIRDRKVHQLVLEAFVGPCPEGLVVRHLNDIPQDNRLVNLAYGTRSENAMDSIDNGTHNWTPQAQCSKGHPYTKENTYWTSSNQRGCRACLAARHRERYLRTLMDALENGPVPVRLGGECHRGHPFDEENTYMHKTGDRECRRCRNERSAMRRRRQREQSQQHQQRHRAVN